MGGRTDARYSIAFGVLDCGTLKSVSLELLTRSGAVYGLQARLTERVELGLSLSLRLQPTF